MKLKHILRKGIYAAAIIGAVSFASPSDTQAATYIEQEDNDTFQTAQPLNVNSVIQGEIAKKDSIDFYKIEAPANGRLSFELPNISGRKWEVLIYDENAKILERNYTDNSSTALGSSTFSAGVTSGTYYIAVKNYTDTIETPYTGVVTFKQTNHYEREKNDTFATATPVTVNNEINGIINYDDSHDYYQFTVDQPGLTTLSMPNVPNKEWTFSILTEDGKVLNSTRTDSSSTASDRTMLHVGLPVGTYYIDVQNHRSTAYQEYSYILEHQQGHYEREVNNSIQQANLIQLNETYSGLITNSDSFDYYTFELQRDVVTTIQIKNQHDKTWDLRLYDANGKQITSMKSNPGSTAEQYKTIQKLLPAGKYYVSVQHGSYTWQTMYDFSVNIPSTANFKDVPSSHPYFNEINEVRNMGIITGYEDGTFKPNNNISRQHIAAMIARSNAKLDSVRYSTSFADVSSGNAYYDAIQTLYKAGIIDGSVKGYSRYFEPSANITRAQLSKILVNAYDLDGNTTTNHYTDLKSADWYTPYANILAANGIILDNTKKFNGKKFVTRGELAYMIKKASDASK